MQKGCIKAQYTVEAEHNPQGKHSHSRSPTITDLLSHSLGFAGDNINLNAPWLTVGFQAVRVVNGNSQSYKLAATMQQARWYPSVVTQADGNALIVGGMQQVFSSIGVSSC